MKKKKRQIKKENVQKPNLRFVLLVLALLPIFYSAFFQGGYFPWEVYETLLLSLPALFLFFYVKIVSGEGIVKSGADKGIFAFAAVAFLSLFFTVYFHATLTEFYKMLIYIALFYIAIDSVQGEKDVNIVLWAILSLGFILSFLGILAYFGAKLHLKGAFFGFLSKNGFVQGVRVSSSLQYANTFGAFLILPVFISLSYLIRSKKLYEKIIYGILTLFFLFTLFLTQSRGALIVLVIVWVLYLILLQGVERRRGILYTGVLIALFVLLVLVKKDMVMPVLQGFGKRLDALFMFLKGKKNVSLGNRENMLKDSLKILKAHSIFGTGNGTYQYIYMKYRSVYFFSKFPHSIFFQVLDELGIVGGAAFLYMLYVLFKKGFSVLSKTRSVLLVGLYAGLSGILLHAFVDFDWSLMFMPLLFFFGFGVMLSQKEKEYFTFKCPIPEKRKEAGVKKAKTYKVKTGNGKKFASLIAITLILFLLFIFPFAGARADFNAKASIGRVQWQKTANEFKSAISFDPICAEYHYDLAHFYFQNIIPASPNPEQFISEAVNQYKEAIKYCPEFFLYHFELARLYLQTGNKDAISEFTKAVELNPIDPGGHASLGFAYLKLNKDTVMAKTQFEEALKLDPKNSDAYLGMGSLYEELKDVENAIKNYKLAIKYNRKSAYAYYRLGVLYEEQSKLPEAVNNLFYAVYYNPNLKEAKTEFEKFAPIITVMKPQAGESVKIGSAYKIQWIASNDKNVQYYNVYLIPKKGKWILVKAGVKGTSYVWDIPDSLNPGAYKIRIYAVSPKFMQGKFGGWLSFGDVDFNIVH